MLRTRTLVFVVTSSAASWLATPAALGQWVSDPTANSSVGDGASDQTQPKLVATADGGVFVSWYDGIANGFDVRLQKLDADGKEVMAHNGVLVANRSFSSTQDYGLAIDAAGDALLAFRDDRPGGIQITAARVASDGTAQWGPLGVQLTGTTSFVAAPKIAGPVGGGAVVAWTQDSTVRLQKLDASGVPQWANDVVLTPTGGSYSVADLHAAGTDVIVSMVHQTGGFTSPKRLVTQKLDVNGAPQWGAAPLAVFDAGSLQFGNFPPFTPDGSGGAVFGWYQTSPLQCYAQRIRSDGSEAFPHNGVAVSTNGAQIRVSPTVSFVPESEATIVSWVEQNSGQSMFGLASQKLDATGNRQWGSTGATHLPLGATEISNVRNVTDEFRTFVFWVSTPSFGQGVLRGLRLDTGGAIDVAPFDVASPPSTKSRLDATMSAVGQAILAWTDQRVDSGDVYAQNVNCDGTLGPPSATAPWTDLGQGLAGGAGLPLLVGTGPMCEGSAFSLSLTNALPNATAALVLGASALNAPFAGGTFVPNPDLIFFGLPTGAAGAIGLTGALPAAFPPGFELVLQYWIVDAAGPQGYAASNGLKVTGS